MANFHDEVAEKLDAAGLKFEPILMDYAACLEAMRGVVADQVSKIHARNPEATGPEVRSSIIEAMRKALRAPRDDWEKLEPFILEKDSLGEQSVFLLYSMVAAFRQSFGIDPSDPVTQETLMVEVQKALDESLS